jgi:hypothetical protein
MCLNHRHCEFHHNVISSVHSKQKGKMTCQLRITDDINANELQYLQNLTEISFCGLKIADIVMQRNFKVV